MLDRERRRRGLTVVELIIVVGIIATLAVLAIPGLLSSRKNSNEASAIGTLRLLATSQTAFREADKDSDGQADYAGTLAELAQANLVDDLVGSGSKHGYVFDLGRSPTRPDTLWFALGSPAVPGSTGDRWFGVNHAGVIFYTTGPAPVFDPNTCLIPAGMLPVGQ